MQPESILLKSGLTAWHFSMIDALVLENKSDREICLEFEIEIEHLNKLRRHPLWVKQERVLVKEEKEEAINSSIEELYPDALSVLKASLSADKFMSSGHKVADNKIRLTAAIKCIDLAIEAMSSEGRGNKPFDVFIPDWMRDQFKKKDLVKIEGRFNSANG